jgi:signal transduction histidine kinase/ActR/RegA family two-component response regulator
VTATGWRLPAILAALLALLTYLVVRSTGSDSAQHEAIVEAFHRVTVEDAALHRDALKARAGLLPNYDPLVQAVDDLHAAIAALQAIEPGNPAISAGLQALTREAEAQEDLIEAFKSDNAVLQNSMAYFTHGIHALNASRTHRVPEIAAQVSASASAMLRFMRDPQGEAAEELAVVLGRLRDQSARPDAEVRSLVAHGEIILGVLPAVDQTLTRLLSGNAARQAQALQTSYLDHHARVERRAKAARLVLYAVSVLLLTWLASFWLRLWQSARALRGRLAFESLLVDVSARFVDLPAEQAGAGITSGLARLGHHMAVDRAYVLAADATFAWAADEAAHACDAPWRLLDVFEDCIRGGYVLVPRVQALPDGRERAALEARRIRSWLALPIRHAGKRMGFLVFEAVRQERRWSKDDIALLHTVSDIFGSAVARGWADDERKALETRLHYSERMEAIGALAGGIAHNFNNVLGAILGYGEMALMALPAGGRARVHVEQVAAAGRRGKQLVDQILAFGRRGAPALRPIRIRPVIDEAVGLLRASLPATISIRTQLDEEDAVVASDPTELQQVVMNLCTNAAQAMGGHGVVDVAVSVVERTQVQVLSHGSLPPGRYARLAVSDTGQGIDAATMDRIFEPFFTTRAAAGGTGLGLASVQGIVADHGGAVNVRSRSGEGSTFEAYFPTTDAPAVAEERVAAAVPLGRGETVLVVDDDRPLALLAEEMLAALGYEPVGFDNSVEALAAFRADPHRFDLVLSDEVMPGLTGSRLAAAIHAIRPEVPIVLMTGHGGAIDPNQLRSSGVREVLKKPLLARDIAESMARRLSSGTAKQDPVS